MPFCANDAPTAGESASDIFSAMYNYYPGLAQVYRDQLLPTAQAELKTSQAVSPAFQQLMTDLYRDQGPQLAQIGQGIDRSNRLAAAQTDADIIAGPGATTARSYQALDRELNPEFYATRAAGAGKLSELLGSINLSDPNPEAERLISQEAARSGNMASPSQTNTVANAISFGEAANNRRTNLTAAINAATNFLQPSSTASNFNPATTALNRPTSNTGSSQFAGVNNTAGQGSQSAALGFTNQLGDLQRLDVENRTSIKDQIDQGFSSI